MEYDEPVVRIAIRIKPTQTNDEVAIRQSEDDENNVLDLFHGKGFAYDVVFNEKSLQKQVYEKLVEPNIKRLFDGYSSLTIAMGRSGTGKSYTMGLNHEMNSIQEDESAGFVYRAIVDIFNVLKESSGENDSDIYVSFLEVYNEKVHDLLDEGGSRFIQKGAIRSDVNRRLVKTVDEALLLLETGNNLRHIRPTKLNSSSSRSHAIFSIHVNTLAVNGDYNRKINAGLYLVDLAGSEGVKRTGNEGAALAEGNYINQGLLALGKVLQALSSGNKVIPYRDSVLTQLLQESLNTNCYVTLLGCINPVEYQGSMSTLRFTQSAKQIKINPQVNEYLKEIGRGQTPFKTPLHPNAKRHDVRHLFYPPLSTVKRPESRHTICTPRKKTKLEFVKPFNSTTVEEPKIPEVAEFFHPSNFQDALEMIREVPQPAEKDRDSIPMSTLNVSTSTTKDTQSYVPDTFRTPSCSYNCTSQTVSPIIRRIENLETLLETKFQKLYDTFVNNQSMTAHNATTNAKVIQDFRETVRGEIDDIKNLSRNTDTVDNSKISPKKNENQVTRRSTRLFLKRNEEKPAEEVPKTKLLKQNQRKSIAKPSTIQTISKATHKASVFNILKNGTLKELKMLATVGDKTAHQIMSIRNIKGILNTWNDVAKLPIWKGNGWNRFKQTNMVD